MITTDQIDRLRRNMQPNNQKALRGNPHAPAEDEFILTNPTFLPS